VSLAHCVVDDTLSQAMLDLRQALLQFFDRRHELDECHQCFHHASMLEEDILAFNVSQEYIHRYVYLV